MCQNRVFRQAANVRFWLKADSPSDELNVGYAPERCYEAEGCGLMLLLPFNGDLKERSDDGKFYSDFQRTVYLCGA